MKIPIPRWVLGAGRLYLPWATSLETLDGGYFGVRVGHGVTTGIFGGSTPDPTSWTYNPNRHLGGGFLSTEGGSYDGVRYSSTAGFARVLKPFRTRPLLLRARRRQPTKITGPLRSLKIRSLISGFSRSSAPCRAISPAQIPPRLLPALASAAVFSP